jgi:hypothetical protein
MVKQVVFPGKRTAQESVCDPAYRPVCVFCPWPLAGLAWAGTAATNSAPTIAIDATNALSDRVANKIAPPGEKFTLYRQTGEFALATLAQKRLEFSFP